MSISPTFHCVSRCPPLIGRIYRRAWREPENLTHTKKCRGCAKEIQIRIVADIPLYILSWIRRWQVKCREIRIIIVIKVHLSIYRYNCFWFWTRFAYCRYSNSILFEFQYTMPNPLGNEHYVIIPSAKYYIESVFIHIISNVIQYLKRI